MDKFEYQNTDINSVNIEEQKILQLIDLNFFPDSSVSFIAALQPCPLVAAKNTWSEYVTKPKCQSEWEELVARALEPSAADNPYQIVQPDEISAIHSVNHTQGSYGLDSRPKIYDKATKTWILCDTGSCICIPKEPGDELDSKLSLKPVNGGVIKTFRPKEISIQIGRKAYSIKAVKTEIPQTILGWDLFRKFSLGLEWNDYRDLFITEKKAGIKSLLKHLAIPSEEVPRIEEVVNSTYAMSPYTITLEAIYFQTECMKQLTEEASLEVSIDTLR